MPVTISIEDKGRGIVLRASGQIASKEISSSITAFAVTHRDALAAARYWLSDYRLAATISAEPVEVGKLADFCVGISVVNPSLLVAICAPQQLTFGFARMWEMLAAQTSWSIHVTSDYDDAVRWIGSEGGEPVTPG